ncbi:CHY zinc finger protein [Lentibacillus juripiscarius]|uniref:CHY zinc finger protein n=1 Tax=Lentibacillus juripiscarius TaxID=257446 RepID=A0ABW5V6U2_9BACI
MEVTGAIDHETRCRHYSGRLDRIAIKFYCCGAYFSCIQCHEEYGCGARKIWPREAFGEKAILCGSCQTELTIHTYLTGENKCPICGEAFNSGCVLHHHLYFDV